MGDGVAIVIGGSQSVWAELDAAQILCRDAGVKPRYFVANDMIEHFSKECVCCTLHVEKLPAWLANRTIKGMCLPSEVWICTQEKNRPGAMFATNIMDDWGGSSGLFMTKIAIQHYGLKVILCGVPLTQSGNHFVRKAPWTDVVTFEHRWIPHLHYLRPRVRSFSGKTLEWFGPPHVRFIGVRQEDSYGTSKH